MHAKTLNYAKLANIEEKETPSKFLDRLREALCYYCVKKGHLKRDFPQASKLPPAPCRVCKGPHSRRDCPQRRRSQGSDSQDNQD